MAVQRLPVKANNRSGNGTWIDYIRAKQMKYVLVRVPIMHAAAQDPQSYSDPTRYASVMACRPCCMRQTLSLLPSLGCGRTLFGYSSEDGREIQLRRCALISKSEAPTMDDQHTDIPPCSHLRLSTAWARRIPSARFSSMTRGQHTMLQGVWPWIVAPEC